MSSNEINCYWPHDDRSKGISIDMDSKDIAGTKFFFQCNKCQLPCKIHNKSPPTYICNECNVIYCNIPNNAQERKESISLQNSESLSPLEIMCVLSQSESDNCIDSDYTLRSDNKKNVPHQRDISITIPLNTSDIGSASVLSLNNTLEDYDRMISDKKIQIKPQLKLDVLTMSTQTTVNTQDSTIANKSNSPILSLKITQNKIENSLKSHVKIIRRKSKTQSTWSPSLKTLPEKYEIKKISNKFETIMDKNKQDYDVDFLSKESEPIPSIPSVSPHMNSSVTEAFGEYMNDGYYNNDEDDNNASNPDAYIMFGHFVEAQQALQEAYLKGFTQGYSTGVQFLYSGFPDL